MRLLQRVPFVRMAAVCNNVAMGMHTEDSDIDLFFVIKKGRLFTSRFLITALLHILGVRRHGEKIKQRFCLSFFIDDENLNLERIAIEDDYYLMHWCQTMIPFIDRSVLNRFENENKWVPNLRVRRDYLLSEKKPLFEWLFGDFIEGRLKRWQFKRALGKMNNLPRSHGVIVNDHILKFHDRDRREDLREKMKSKISV